MASAGSPLTVSADHSVTTLDTRADSGQTTYRGHVVIRRGTTVIHGAQAVVHTRHQRLEKAVVTGKPATFSLEPSGDERPVHGQAHSITYKVGANTLVLEGNATLHRGGQTFSAARVQYDLGTGTLKARGHQGERVHVVIPPARSAPAPATSHS